MTVHLPPKTFHRLAWELESAVNRVDLSYRVTALRLLTNCIDGTLGVVLVYRPRDDSWITWEWNDYHTGDGRVTLYMGHYDMSEAEGQMDFEARAR